MQQDNIEYLSGEVKEILSSPPSWVSTWGIAVLVGTVGLIAFAGGIFHYPEIVTGNVSITTQTPPVIVVSPKSEYIAEVKVKDNMVVKTGDVLAVFPSDADYKDVLKLEEDMETVGQLDLDKLRIYSPNRSLNIGELRQSYSNFITAFELVPLDESGEIDYATVAAVENTNMQYQKQVKSLEASLPSIKTELEALGQELKNAHHNYAKTTDTTYAAVIFNVNSKIKNKEAEYKRIQNAIEATKTEISKSNIRKFQAQTQAKSGAGEAIFQLNKRLDDLRTEIKNWKNSHLIISPSNGIVQMYMPIKAPQLVNAGDALFTILPEDIGDKFVGKVELPVDRSGKVKEGQQVNIKFERYRFREFGTVKAKVTKVYPVAKDNAFYADIVIENGLVTTLNRKLDFYQQMSGKAEIVTDDKTFISKLFEKFTAQW